MNQDESRVYIDRFRGFIVDSSTGETSSPAGEVTVECPYKSTGAKGGFEGCLRWFQAMKVRKDVTCCPFSSEVKRSELFCCCSLPAMSM